jgi:hypothetical protein
MPAGTRAASSFGPPCSAARSFALNAGARIATAKHSGGLQSLLMQTDCGCAGSAAIFAMATGPGAVLGHASRTTVGEKNQRQGRRPTTLAGLNLKGTCQPRLIGLAAGGSREF